jgi:hypothetical protein
MRSTPHGKIPIAIVRSRTSKQHLYSITSSVLTTSAFALARTRQHYFRIFITLRFRPDPPSAVRATLRRQPSEGIARLRST